MIVVVATVQCKLWLLCPTSSCSYLSYCSMHCKISREICGFVASFTVFTGCYFFGLPFVLFQESTIFTEQFSSYTEIKNLVDEFIASKHLDFFQCGIKFLPNWWMNDVASWFNILWINLSFILERNKCLSFIQKREESYVYT